MLTTIWRYDRSGKVVQCEDEVTEERTLTIYVNGTLAVHLASSGEPVEAAAVGHAVSEGWARPDQVLAVTVEERSAFLTLSSEAQGPGVPTTIDIDCVSGDTLTGDLMVSRDSACRPPTFRTLPTRCSAVLFTGEPREAFTRHSSHRESASSAVRTSVVTLRSTRSSAMLCCTPGLSMRQS